MSDVDKGRALYAQRNHPADGDEPDPTVTGIDRGRQMWERRKSNGAFGPAEPPPADVTPGGDAA